MNPLTDDSRASVDQMAGDVARVLVNDEGQHCVWPVDLAAPAGWSVVGEPGRRADTIAYVEACWTDIRPRSRLDAEAAGRRVHAAAIGEEGDTLIGLLAAQVARRPDAIAVSFGGEELTYTELNERSDRVARVIAQPGVGPDVVIGICLPCSAELVVAILAILKVGAAFLLLDTELPVARRVRMVVQSGAALLLTNAGMARDFSGHASESEQEAVPLLCLDDPAVVTRLQTLPVSSQIGSRAPSHSDRLAYVIYTSGSTGSPKGVAVSVGNLINLVKAGQQVYRLPEGARVAWSVGVSFDPAVEQLFLCLSLGGCLIIGDDSVRLHPARFFVDGDTRPDYLALTPTVARDLLTLKERQGPTCLVLGGEQVDPVLLRALQLRQPEWRIINAYGPTECTVCATMFEVGGSGTNENTIIPIGRPLSNVVVHLLDAKLHETPDDTAGELYIAGAGLAHGYIGQPGLTAERFLASPFGPPGARMYRTGDLARRLPDGTLEFRGRADQQLKVNGVRIEPAEIEDAVVTSANGLLSQALAAVRRAPDGSDRLIAYVVRKAGEDTLVEEALRAACAMRLPAALVPSSFVVLDEWPLTPGGKIDKQALPEPAFAPDRPLHTPTLPVEHAICGVVSSILRREPVGLDDNFFSLGGDSLAAVELTLALRDLYGLRLPVRDIYTCPTIAGLCRRVRSANGQVRLTQASHASGRRR